MGRWSDDTTFKFVSAYVEQECLWNVKSPLYKNKAAKAAAIDELDKAMSIPGFQEKEIKQKIKNIRSTYSQELRKVKDSKLLGAGLVYVPSIKWFRILDDRLRNLNTDISLNDSNLANEDNTYEHTEDSSISTATEAEGGSPIANFRQPKPVNKSNKRKLSDLKSMVSELKYITETANSSSEENEFDVFGKHVALQLKSLPLLLALEAQEHIQMFLNRIRRQHIMQNSSKQNRSGTTSHAPMGSPYSSSDESCNLQSPQSALSMGEVNSGQHRTQDTSAYNETSQQGFHSSDSTHSAGDVIASAMCVANLEILK